MPAEEYIHVGRIGIWKASLRDLPEKTPGYYQRCVRSEMINLVQAYSKYQRKSYDPHLITYDSDADCADDMTPERVVEAEELIKLAASQAEPASIPGHKINNLELMMMLCDGVKSSEIGKRYDRHPARISLLVKRAKHQLQSVLAD